MKRIVILSNHHAYTYNFRKEIIQDLIEKNYKVYIVLPDGEKVNDLVKLGCEFINISLDRRGMNPFLDAILLKKYITILKMIKPEAVLSYTIKPNVYGGMACRLLKIPFFPNITGLGTAIENKGVFQSILVKMSKISYKNAQCIFFQNEENMTFFKNKGILKGSSKLIPGSGVNTERFTYLRYPNDEQINFLFISRIMKEKGIDQYLEAASIIKKKYNNTNFHILGFCEEKYEEKLNEYQDRKIITYHGMQSDIIPFLRNSHCTIHPTYYPEGMSNVLLESASSGRPIITTDRSGCKEIVDDGINGFIVKQKNTQDLVRKIEKFLLLNNHERERMGINAREKIVKEFDRSIVVNAYMNELSEINEMYEELT
ncbi:glycosyltransferase family 4 protein [Rossellomorea sp. H39__3]